MELKENEYKEVFEEELAQNHSYVRDVEIDTDIEMLIPDLYINQIEERLVLYTQLDRIENEKDLIAFRESIADRFGPIPEQVDELFNGLRLRWIAKKLGFERIILKKGMLKCFFLANAQSSYYESPLFKEIMKYISTHGKATGFSIKQSRSFLILSKTGIKNINQACSVLQQVYEKTKIHESVEEFSE